MGYQDIFFVEFRDFVSFHNADKAALWYLILVVIPRHHRLFALVKFIILALCWFLLAQVAFIELFWLFVHSIFYLFHSFKLATHIHARIIIVLGLMGWPRLFRDLLFIIIISCHRPVISRVHLCSTLYVIQVPSQKLFVGHILGSFCFFVLFF